MRHFLFEDKEYKLRATFKRRAIRDAATELSNILNRHSGSYKACSHQKTDYRQRCTAKMQYSNSIEAHRVQLEKYLIREGTALDGTQAELFGTDQKEYQNNMDARNFRIFLSPESSNTNLTELANRFIAKLEKQTGYQFFWQGACHYNTSHPHVHLLINGIDKHGKEIKFPKDIVKTFMRETARDICTSQIGRRTHKEIELQKEQELYSARWIKQDNHIQDLCGRFNRIPSSGMISQRTLIRIETLKNLQLCKYENGGYTFKDGWQDDLKANGKYNYFLKARQQLQYSTPSLFKVYSGEDGTITGKITKIVRTDGDASDSHAVVIECLDGTSYFVPLLKKPELHDSGNKTPLKEGDLTTVYTYTTQHGRLTPVFSKRDVKSIKNEIRKKGHSGNLALSI